MCLLLSGTLGRICAQDQPSLPQTRPPAAQTSRQPPITNPEPAQTEAQTALRTPPPKPEISDEPGDNGLSAGLFYWYNPMHPKMRTGHGATVGNGPSTLDYPSKDQPTPGAIVSVPVGRTSAVRISYFRTNGLERPLTAAENLNFFATDYPAGTAMRVGYNLQNAKVSLDYLTWPFPLEGSTFRIKTLWQLQYTSIHTTVNAPDIVDSSGNPAPQFSEGTDWFVYPTLGLGVEKIFSKSLRWELQGSGFWLPHRSNIGDADSFFAYRHGSLEVDFGAKYFHFRTSPKKNEYVAATLPGAYLGIRWYLR